MPATPASVFVVSNIGSADAMVGRGTSPVAKLEAGQLFIVEQGGGSNVTPLPTLSVVGEGDTCLGPLPITNRSGAPVAPGDFGSFDLLPLFCTGTTFVHLGLLPSDIGHFIATRVARP